MSHKLQGWALFLFATAILPLSLIGEVAFAKSGATKGRLRAIAVDDEHPRVEHYLEEMEGNKATGRKFKINFQKEPSKNFRTGSFVEIKGDINEDSITAEGPSSVTTISGTSTTESTASGTTATGTRSVAILLVNFSDVPLGCSASSVANKFFGSALSVNALHVESSYNKVGFTGDVFGPFTLSSVSSASSCNWANWETMAQQVATAAGINLNNYQHVYYEFPKINSCSGSGWADIIGRNAASYYCSSVGSAIHELGHNLGMNHAATSGDEYGDYSDNMGNFWRIGNQIAHHNAPHKEKMGWLTVPQITQSGTYTLTALEYSNGQAVKIAMPNTSAYYYVSLRAPVLFDIGLPLPFPNNVSVHSFSGGTSNTILHQVLSSGASFTDSTRGITITQVSSSGTSATVQITMPSATVTNRAPTANNDSYATDMNRALSIAAPGVLANDSDPDGQAIVASLVSQPSRGTVSLSSNGSFVYTPYSNLSGYDSFTYKVSDGQLSSNTATVTINVRSSATPVADTTAPTVRITSPVTGSKVGGANLKVSVAATDNIAVTKVELYLNGVLTGTSTSSPATFSVNTKRQLRSGTNTFQSKAYDAAGNVGVSATVDVVK